MKEGTGSTTRKKKTANKYQPQEIFSQEKPRFCDPSACRFCDYVGNGDFVCSKDPTNRIGIKVVANWEPTQKYLHCRQQNRKRGNYR